MLLSQYKKIIIHCGIHKTGSSYLQHMLKGNSAALEGADICFPTSPNRYYQRTGNHSAIAVEYEKVRDIQGLIQSKGFFESQCKTLLLSGEEFARYLPRGLFMADLVKAAGNAQLQFIFYLRRHDHLLESVYAESVKNSLVGDISRTVFQFDFFEILRPFIEAVGKQNIVVRPYNSALWPDGGIGADFCEAIGHPDLWRSLEIPQEPINASFSREHTFLLSRQESPAAKSRLTAFFGVRPLPNDPGQSKFFMSPQERQQFRMSHAASAQRAGDIFGIHDINAFLGIEDAETEPDWEPFQPDWRSLTQYMSEFGDWVCAPAA